MKIICTSDWHLGNLFHGNDRLDEHKDFFKWLLAELEEQQPDALLVAGDVFDNGNPSAAAQSAYYKFLAEATQSCPTLQIVITAGNHDSASRLEAPRELLTHHRVEVRGTIKRQWVTDDDGQGDWQIDYDDLLIPVDSQAGDRVIVLAVPYLRSDVVRDASYSRGVNRLLRSLTARARELYPDTPLVMMAHMYAKGADIASRDASERIIIGGQEQVSMDGWNDHPDYLTCGHIHKRQHIWDTNWARYTGSVLPMSFVEKDYTHGVDLVTLTAGHRPMVKQLEYTPQHRLRVLPEDGADLTVARLKRLINDELQERTSDKPDDHFDYVWLKVRRNRVNHDDAKMLMDLVNSKNAVLCKTESIIEIVNPSASVGERTLTSVDDILNRDPLETLQEAFVAKHNAEMNERQKSLLTDVINSIKNKSND